MGEYYNRNPMERVTVIKASQQLRCDGIFRGRRCNAMLAQRFQSAPGTKLEIKCARCGKLHRSGC